MSFGIGYQDMIGNVWNDAYSEYIKDSNRSFRSSLNLNPNLIPKVSKVEYFYQRNNDLDFNLLDLFTEDNSWESISATHGYNIGIEASSNMTIIYQSRTTYRYNESGELEPIRIMQLDTQFYF